MTIKPLNAALLIAGLVAGGTAAGLNLPQWMSKADHNSTVQSAASTTPSAVAVLNAPNAPAAVPYLPASRVPDYRSIFKQAGPAVVGVTVEGMHKVSREVQGAAEAEADPFAQFFRGMPGMQGMQPRGRGQQAQPSQPFRGQGSGFRSWHRARSSQG